MKKNSSSRKRHLFFNSYMVNICKSPAVYIGAIIIILFTNGFRPNSGEKFRKDCMANMFRINAALVNYANSSSDTLILGNGESIASYPMVLQSFADGCPVCPLLENQDSGFTYYSVIKASESFEVSCPLHGSRSDYLAGKEIIITEKQRQLIENTVNKRRISFFAEVLLINLIIAGILWLPTVLMRIFGKTTQFIKSFRTTLKIHRMILIIICIACLPAIMLASTIATKTVITATTIFTLISFIVAKAFEMAYLPTNTGN